MTYKVEFFEDDERKEYTFVEASSVKEAIKKGKDMHHVFGWRCSKDNIVVTKVSD